MSEIEHCFNHCAFWEYAETEKLPNMKPDVVQFIATFCEGLNLDFFLIRTDGKLQVKGSTEGCFNINQAEYAPTYSKDECYVATEGAHNPV